MNHEFLRAVRLKNLGLIKRMDLEGVDLSMKDEEGKDAIFYCIVNPDMGVFNYLMDRKVDLKSIYKEKKNLLHIAVESNLEERGYFEIIQRLIKFGVEVNHQDKYGNIPLWYACIYYVINKKTIRCLLENGSNMDLKNNYETNVYMAAKNNERVELLNILEEFKSIK